MEDQDQILALFEEYFKTASKEEIERDVAYVNNLGKGGISFEQYLMALSKSTSLNLSEFPLPEDVAIYNESIGRIKMDDADKLQSAPSVQDFKGNQDTKFNFAGENTYAMAA